MTVADSVRVDEAGGRDHQVTPSDAEAHLDGGALVRGGLKNPDDERSQDSRRLPRPERIGLARYCVCFLIVETATFEKARIRLRKL
jgi:hypothetical protein